MWQVYHWRQWCLIIVVSSFVPSWQAIPRHSVCWQSLGVRVWKLVNPKVRSLPYFMALKSLTSAKKFGKNFFYHTFSCCLLSLLTHLFRLLPLVSFKPLTISFPFANSYGLSHVLLLPCGQPKNMVLSLFLLQMARQ